MKQFLKIEIEVTSSEEAEILIAQLSGINFYAFEEENNLLNAYVNEEDFDEEKLKEILPYQTIFTKKIIQEENWNQQWESQLEPVIINTFVAIRPSFSPRINNVKYDLMITPKMSFGTGHHATTHLMVELMESIDFSGKTVVDFGTGTGVLAILAEKCEASDIIAIDYDEWSIANAKENIDANNCNRIKLNQQNSLSGINEADIILANINLNVIKEVADSIVSIAKSGTILLVSGFLDQDQIEMQKIFEGKGFVKLKNKKAGDWLAILFEKK
jgi:ribosomal protein L11 methyltransferase